MFVAGETLFRPRIRCDTTDFYEKLHPAGSMLGQSAPADEPGFTS